MHYHVARRINMKSNLVKKINLLKTLNKPCSSALMAVATVGLVVSSAACGLDGTRSNDGDRDGASYRGVGKSVNDAPAGSMACLAKEEGKITAIRRVGENQVRHFQFGIADNQILTANLTDFQSVIASESEVETSTESYAFGKEFFVLAQAGIRSTDPDEKFKNCANYTFPVAEYNTPDNTVGTIDEILVPLKRGKPETRVLSIDTDIVGCWKTKESTDNSVYRQFGRNDLNRLFISQEKRDAREPKWSELIDDATRIHDGTYVKVDGDCPDLVIPSAAEEVPEVNAPAASIEQCTTDYVNLRTWPLVDGTDDNVRALLPLDSKVTTRELTEYEKQHLSEELTAGWAAVSHTLESGEIIGWVSQDFISNCGGNDDIDDNDGNADQTIQVYSPNEECVKTDQGLNLRDAPYTATGVVIEVMNEQDRIESSTSDLASVPEGWRYIKHVDSGKKGWAWGALIGPCTPTYQADTEGADDSLDEV